MPATERSAGRSAPYGQACLSCFKTKCKCIPRPDGNGCERCHRLKRPCHSTDAVRRRGDKKQSPSEARIAKLEGTLGQLVSLLQAGSVNMEIMGNVDDDRANVWSQQQQLSPAQQSHHLHQQAQRKTQQPPCLISQSQDVVVERTERSSTTEKSRATSIDEDHDDTDADTVSASASWLGGNNTNGLGADEIFLTTPPSSTASGALMSPISSSSASTSLDTFRLRMLHHFPFVYLPTHLTAEQLRLDRPFLFRAILCVTSASDEDKRASSLELKRVLCETVFLQRSLQPDRQESPQRTVDLLLGLLVYVAWGWEHLLSRRSLSRLMAVAISLVGELHVQSQAVPVTTRIISQLEPKNGSEDMYGSATATTAMPKAVEVTNTHLYLERQRAILGYFVLGSAVSAHFSQIDAPRWIPQMDKSLAAIVANTDSTGAECPSDASLAIQVRLQLLAMKAAQVRERAQLPDQPPPETLSPQALLYIKALMGQLQDLRASIPPAFQRHFALLAQTYYTEMCIIETIHIQDSVCSPPPTCGPTRVSCFWQAALAIKSCVSTFLTLSPSGLVGVSFIQWAQLARCVATLQQLSTVQEPGWDPVTVSKLVDLPVLLSCTADKLELAAAEAGQQPGSADGVFTQLARGLRTFQSAYHGRGLLTEQEEAQSTKEAVASAKGPADADKASVATTEMSSYALPHSQQAEYLMSPTLWLDQFFLDDEDQSLSGL
ncbi:uncharacterized protein N7477_002199 [Penicillium maclennaniae]|uniref:uncharacterized protein n=1 Tax=Penicillium maclennaniae TaxID=1343394 RepID=UPI002540569F|nr:uncharacterized protein N7477_002199 [Penicillium maclennaniae]KAJ5676566.1 hypothetical protein N7477_002199 [Penicillium maclennaniae]